MDAAQMMIVLANGKTFASLGSQVGGVGIIDRNAID